MNKKDITIGKSSIRRKKFKQLRSFHSGGDVALVLVDSYNIMALIMHLLSLFDEYSL